MNELEEKTMHKQQFILGGLCIALPFMSILFGLFGVPTHVNYFGWWYSISATYYANSKIVMIGLLFTTGIYFWSYKGYDIFDDLITKIAAISSFGIITFPTYTPYEHHVGLFSLETNVSLIFHCISAFTFYLCFLAILLRFRKTTDKKTMSDKKKLRNKFYLIFGIVISVCIALIVMKIVFKWPDYVTIILETILQICCGISWLIKAGAFKNLND